MNKSINLLVVFILLSFFVNAQTTFQNYYDRDLLSTSYFYEFGQGVAETTDGGFIVVGNTNLGFGPDDVYAVRMDSEGDTLWVRVYGELSKKEYARAVVETIDGGFVLVGESRAGSSTYGGFIMKTDSLGTLLWSKTTTSNYEMLNDVIEMTDGSLIVAGRTQLFGAGGADIAIIKLSSAGLVLWSKAIGGSGDEYANAIENTSDGGFVIAGNDGTYSWGGFGVVKFDVNGDTLWSRGYRVQVSNYEGLEIDQTSDGGYIVSGTTYGGTIGGLDMVMLKISSTGVVEWSRDYGSVGTDQYGGAVQTSDGGYLLGGVAPINGASIGDMVMIKTDGNGVISWSKGYSAEYGSYAFSINPRFQVMESSDGAYVLVGGCTNNFWNTISNSNSYDLIITKADTLGNVPQGCFKNAGLISSVVTYTEFMAPYSVVASTPSLTSATFSESNTAGNYSHTGLRMDFVTTGVSCGLCDGTALVDLCDTIVGTVCSGAEPYTYLWDVNAGSQTSASATGLCSGGYTITVTDFIGCTGVGTTAVSSAALPQEICLVTVDSAATKNVVVWEKPVTTAIDSFRIYRDIVGVYTHIGSVAYADLSEFVDFTNGVNPQTTSYRYKISTIDTCGNESALSAYHETIHLTLNGSNLIWDNYEGFPFFYYRILRDTIGLGGFTKIDSVTNNNFTFTDPNPSLNYNNYKIEIVHPDGCTAEKTKNYNSSKSNTSFAIGTGINAKNKKTAKAFLLVSPNPFTEFTNISYETSTNGPVQFEIYDLMGKKVWSYKGIAKAGRHSMIWKPDASGLYFIDALMDSRHFTEKIIKIK